MESKHSRSKTRNRWFFTTRDLLQITGLSKSTIDRLERRGEFPQRVELSKQRIGWVVEEVEAWRRERVSFRKRRKLAQWDTERRKGKIRLSPQS